MSILDMVTGGGIMPWVIGGAVVVAGGIYVAKEVEISALEKQVLEWTSKFNQEHADRMTDIANAERLTRIAEAAAREIETQREADKVSNQEKIDEERKKYSAAVAVADATASRLSKRVAALTAEARRSGSNPQTPGSCEAAIATTDLLGRMLQRVDEDAGRIASYADQLKISGEACVRAYESLIPPAEPASAPSP